ncbi:MAG TPA: hypothetical protein VGE93_17065 [Bryobacteraceae bacterium]
MYTGQLATVSNKATWVTPEAFELYDDTDGTTTDLTALSDLAIVVTIKDQDGCVRATASIDNGKVTVPGPGFQWRFEDTDLSVLCPGTYTLGVKITTDGVITDLVIGTIGVVEGN